MFISLCPDDLSTGPLVTRLRKVFIGVLPWDSMGFVEFYIFFSISVTQVTSCCLFGPSSVVNFCMFFNFSVTPELISTKFGINYLWMKGG